MTKLPDFHCLYNLISNPLSMVKFGKVILCSNIYRTFSHLIQRMSGFQRMIFLFSSFPSVPLIPSFYFFFNFSVRHGVA